MKLYKESWRMGAIILAIMALGTVDLFFQLRVDVLRLVADGRL